MIDRQQIQDIFKVKDGMEVKGAKGLVRKRKTPAILKMQIMNLRKEGFTFKAIGTETDMSTQQVHSLYKKFTEVSQ